jgi:hypothetical protein
LKKENYFFCLKKGEGEKMINKEKKIDSMRKEIIEEFRQEEIELLEFKKIKKEMKKYKSKIKCDGKSRLLQIEVIRIGSELHYFVSMSKYSERFRDLYVSKVFNNLNDALDLYNDLKVKYNGKNLLISLTARNSIIAILSGILAGLIIGELVINLI